MDKILKVPQGLYEAPYNHIGLKLQGSTIIESCTHVSGKTGTMFLEDHLLLFVLRGTYIVKYSRQTFTLGRNEMILLKKSIAVEYIKTGEPETDHLAEYMLFFIKDDFLKDFIQLAKVSIEKTDELVPISIKKITPQLEAFLISLKPFFEQGIAMDEGLLKIKMLELLYGLANADNNLLRQLLQLKQQARTDISYILENNILNPVSMEDLAYLSGRSLSSFKRDFQAIYNVPPSQWIRERRLNKAKELLSNTSLSVTDICYSTGFENAAHFSKLFKEFFGYSPSSLRHETISR